MENLQELEEKLKVKFKDISLLERALTHRSYLNENSSEDLRSNERLEFLGDAVLQFLSSEYIFLKYTDYPEGQLTNLRSRLVNTESLAHEAARLNLGEYLLISKGEQSTATQSAHILANTFEAILGAIYLDQGEQVCREFAKRELLYKTAKILSSGTLKDPKSLFQEFAQENYDITPNYKVLSDSGPDHEKNFIVGVYLGDKLIAKGNGSSKRKAQREAAASALPAEENS